MEVGSNRKVGQCRCAVDQVLLLREMRVQHRRIAVRIEARDYMTRFKGLLGNEAAATRNDVMLGAGLAFHVW